ncbi:hypothetical protein E2X37_23230 [Salmonella enterica]|nr:hypothetical protein [Salmonella enterica]
MTARRASFQLSYITKKPKRIFFRFRQKEITKKKIAVYVMKYG